jgi:hypothetical protein
MDGETNIPEIELIIKASTIDGRRKGACLFCQVSIFAHPNFGRDVFSAQIVIAELYYFSSQELLTKMYANLGQPHSPIFEYPKSHILRQVLSVNFD